MSETVGLRDGSRVRLRPIRPSDKALLRAGFERLGPESRYQRFLVPTDRLTDAAVEYLTDVDHHDHEAIVALDDATGEGVGVARFVRLADRADTAEAAVTVVDDWQARGVGTLLLDCLADRARSEGIARFWALLLAENRDMLDLLERLGPVRTLDRRLGTVEVEAELPSTGAGDELRRVLRASAHCDVRHPDAAARRRL
jgi:GNAT superfamily N-acetyltransferase